MIIDAHLHIGKCEKFDIDLSQVENQMAKYNIDKGIISSIEGVEYIDNGVFSTRTATQLDINSRLMAQVRGKPLYVAFWIRPHNERLTNQVRDYIVANADTIVALKIHPYSSCMPITARDMQEYLGFANEIGLPVMVHTATGFDCECSNVLKVAQQYKNTNFIAAHCDLGTNHQEAVSCIASCDNLFGDVSWINYQDFVNMYKLVGDKLLFATDIAVNRDIGYEYYQDYLDNQQNILNIFFDNIIRAYKLPLCR